MSNTLLTTDLINKEALATLHDTPSFIGLINTQFDSTYENGGGQYGATIRGRKPPRFTTNSQEDLTGLTSDTVEEYFNISADVWTNILLPYTSKELKLDIMDYRRQFLVPAMQQMTADLERKTITKAINGIGNLVVATGDSATQLQYTDVLQGLAKMKSGTTPTNDLAIMAGPFDEADLLNELKSLYQPAKEIGDQYKYGRLAIAGGMDWYMSNALPTVTIGGTVAGAVNGNVSAGAMTMAIDGFSANQVIAAGTVFTVTGVNAVQPEHKTDLGYLYQFTVLESATLDVTGAGTITFASLDGGGEALYATGARKNVTALPADDAVLTLAGAINTTYRQALGFNKNAFSLATITLDAFLGGVTSSTDVIDGVSMRTAFGGDITTGKSLCRADILSGACVMRPQYACKYWIKQA